MHLWDTVLSEESRWLLNAQPETLCQLTLSGSVYAYFFFLFLISANKLKGQKVTTQQHPGRRLQVGVTEKWWRHQLTGRVSLVLFAPLLSHSLLNLNYIVSNYATWLIPKGPDKRQTDVNVGLRRGFFGNSCNKLSGNGNSEKNKSVWKVRGQAVSFPPVLPPSCSPRSPYLFWGWDCRCQ